MRKATMLATAALVGFFVAGCGTQPVMSQSPITKSSDEPLWVAKGVSAFPGEQGKTFFGVGIADAKYYPSISMRRTTAIQRARDDVAAQLRTMVNSVFKDYQKSCFSVQMAKAEMDVVTENVAKNITDETLYGSEPRDVWKDPATGDIYALVAISSESVSQNLRAQIATYEKDRLNKSADAAHQELDNIIDKYRQQHAM